MEDLKRKTRNEQLKVKKIELKSLFYGLRFDSIASKQAKKNEMTQNPIGF